MVRASKFLTDQQRAAVEQAIAQAEANTSAEIVVVVATRSGRYDRAEDLFGMLLAIFAVTIAWVIYQDIRPQTADWVTGDTVGLGVGAVLAVFVLWAIFGAALATWFPILARPFVPRAQFEAEVRRRGFEAFHLFRVGHTGGRDGVLIFVSLLEHMAWVVGDDAITAKLPPSTWDAASRAIAEGIKRGSPDTALIGAISLCAQALAKEFPPRPGDTGQELPNTVRFLD